MNKKVMWSDITIICKSFACFISEIFLCLAVNRNHFSSLLIRTHYITDEILNTYFYHCLLQMQRSTVVTFMLL